MRACDRRIIAELDKRIQVQFNAYENHLAAVVTAHKDEFHEHLEQARREVQAALVAHDRLVVEVDRRHTEQHQLSQQAVGTALDAAERAVELRAAAQDREFHEHLSQYRHEVSLAFAASDKAITKAEVATEKRFESVNEFRAQLSHQATTFMTRPEFDTEIASARAAQESAAHRNADRIQELTDRINRSEGKGEGLSAGWVYLLGALAAVGTIVSLYVAFRTGG